MKTNLSTIFRIARLAAGRWFITTLLLSAVGSLVAQTDKQAWVQRFGTTFGSKELACSIARDSAGNVVIAGDTDEGGLGILVIKYSNTGEGLWTNRFNTSGEDHAAAVAVDGNGNVFVTGSSGSQHVMLAYSSLGVPLWTNQFNGPSGASYTELPSAPAVDNNGNVFITGRFQVPGSVAFATLKYSSAGVPLWTNVFVASANVGYLASALAVDSAGNVVVRGGKHIIKYAGNGVLLWINGCPGAGFLLNVPRSLGVDGTGNVFLLGQSDGAGYFPNNLIVKYSGDGVALWTKSFPQDYAQSLAVDPTGNVAVAGATRDAFFHSGIRTIKYSANGALVWLNEYDANFPNLPFVTVVSGSNGDFFVSGYSSSAEDQVTIKYSAAGSALWTRHAYTWPEDDEDYPRPHPALVIDPGGNALVAGYFFNDYTTDFRTRKYDGAGNEVWVNDYDGIRTVSDSPNAVAVDSSGNIIVTGGGHFDYATIKYSPSGVALWTNYYDGPAHWHDAATAVAVASNGTIFVTGGVSYGDYEDATSYFLTIAYTSEGERLWEEACPAGGSPVGVVVDGNGDVIVAGIEASALGDGGWVTAKYSGAGVPLWTKGHRGAILDNYGTVGGLAVDGHGDVVVVGASPPYFAAIKYSSSGSALWTNRYSPAGGSAMAAAVAIGASGDIFVTGYGSEPGSWADFITIKYSAAGAPLWTNRYAGPAMLTDATTALALDGSGNVLITGYSTSTNDGGDFVTIKYSNDGAALWTNRYAGPTNRQDRPNALAVDRNGNVFVNGGSSVPGTADSVTIAYSSEGVPLWTNRYSGPAGHQDTGRDLAVTGVGEVIVVGSSSGDYATVKYDSGFAVDITSPPQDRTNNAGTTATFSVGVTGLAPFAFQWQRNGTNLVNGGNISGATAANLTLTSVTASDAGSYTVVISNPAGSVTSVVAVLSMPVFENVTATLAPGLPQTWVSSVTWADYDNDGHLDFLLTSSDWIRSQLWRNTGNGFTNVTDEVVEQLPGSAGGSVTWVDYDNDGFLDFLMTGPPQPDSDLPMARLWRNTGGKFTNVTTRVAPGLPGVDGAVTWGDYDNDGRLDFLLAGGTDNGDAGYDIISQLWRNTEHGFMNVTASVLPGLPPMYPASVAWADYDNDGRLDFLITGQTNRGFFSAVSQLWRNTGSGFTNVTTSVALDLPDVAGGSVAWGDYDNDGRLDFIITGQTNWGASNAVSQLWRNTGGQFTDVTASVVPDLPQIIGSSVVWGDYDNDGRLDLLIAGQLWRNTGSGFTNVTDSVLPGLPQGGYASVAWGDFDNDGRLDFLIGGFTNNGDGGFCQLWRNHTPITNTPPSAPTGLAMTASSNAVMLSWNSATDGQTPASGLTYNVRAGTTPGGNNLLSAHVNATNGFRRLPAMGNAMLRHSLHLTGLTNGQTVYWSVQAVDTSFAGGPFATEMSVVSLPQLAFVNVTDTVAPGLPPIRSSSVAWGDFDNDGRQDFIITGYASNSYYLVSQIWRNTGSGFTNMTATVAPGLPQVSDGSVAWADYDNDGRLDFLLTGYSESGYISEIWRNVGSGFTNVTATVAPGLPGVKDSSVAWGDYDNDGRLDFLITGFSGYIGNWVPIFISQIWRNTGSGFANVTDSVAPGLPGVTAGSVAWGDYDNDGRLDFLLTGGIPRRTDQDDDTSLTPISQIWRNTGSGFADVTSTVAPGLLGVHWSSVAWADYDNDGRLDFLITGWNRSIYRSISQLWRNTGAGFENMTATAAPGLPGVSFGSVAWADYDNDGRVDFLLATLSGSQLWRNTPSGFTNVAASVAPGLPPLTYSSVAWSDFDNDGRLDLLLTGALNGQCEVCDAPDSVSQLWQNNAVQTSPPPAVITDPPTDVTNNGVALNARINPRGQVTTAWFVWGNSTNYGNSTAAQPVGNGSSLTNFSATIPGLSAGTTYYYRAVGSNDQGLVFLGFEQRFWLAAPAVATLSGGSMNPASATFNARAYLNNLPAYGWFEWGLTLNLGQVTPAQFLGSGFNTGFAENLSGLQGSTTYYFRAVASNSMGITYGGVQSLVTPFIDVCPGSISPTSRSHGYSGGANSVYLLLQCAWNVVNTNSWITIFSATNGSGSGPLSYTVHPNTLPQQRSGNITIGGHNFRVSQGAGQPVLVAQPSIQTVFGGGTASFHVSVNAASPPFTYQWQLNGVPVTDGNGISGASTSNLVLTGVQYSQAGTYRVFVTNSVGAMVGFSSPAQLIVSCVFALSSNNANFSSLSATGQVALSAAAADCPWSIVNTNPWVTVFSSIKNMGAGTVTYAVAANPTAVPRTASIKIADQTFTITQAGGAATNAAISLAESVDTEGTLSWGTIGTPAWFGQTVLSHDGFDAAQSGPLGDYGAVTMETAVNGPGTLSFWWKVSSDTNRHYLKFFINGVQQTRISGETDWQHQTFALSSGRSVLKWTYSKSDYLAAGQDRGWLDQVQFVPSSPCNLGLLPTSVTHDSTFSTGSVSISTSPGCFWTAVNTNAWVSIVSDSIGSGNGVIEYLLAENSGATRIGCITVGDQLFTITQLAPPTNAPVSLAAALDTVGTPLAWDTIGTPVWFGQAAVSHDGVDAAQSGPVGHNGAVTTHTTVEGPGIISFWWKVSSEEGKDYLKFFVNGVQQMRISGEENWELQNFTLPPGEHVLKWTYSKNATNSVGLDRGWVDQVRFLAGVSPCGVMLSNMSAIHFSNVETGSVNLLGAAEGCKWNVSTTTSWITLLPSDTSGSIPYRLYQNYSMTDRTGVIVINDHMFTVVQRGYTPPCSYSISPNTRSHDANSGTDIVIVTTQPGCIWNVANSNAWITIESSLQFYGSGQVVYSVSSNATGLTRSGNIQIAGYLFTISQSAVAVPLAEALDTIGTPILWETGVSPWTGQAIVTHDGVDAARSGSSSGSALRAGFNGPGTLTFWWKVSSQPNNHTLRLRVNSAEYSRISGEMDWEQRSVTLPDGYHLLEWSYNKVGATTAGQDCGWVDQVQFIPGTNANCGITLSTNSRTHGPAGGSNTVTVTTGVGCPWYVSATNSWITIVSALTNWNNGTMIYRLAPNTNSQARIGSIHIGGQQFLVTQAGTSQAGTNAARLQFMSRTETGATLSVQGEAGKLYVVECSENLIQWIPISTNSAPSTVTDAAAGHAPWRFYRTVELR